METVDAAGEIAKVAKEVVLNLLLPDGARRFFAERFVFLVEAGLDVHVPVRLEDVDHFAELAADWVLADRELRASLIALIKGALHKYMEPA